MNNTNKTEETKTEYQDAEVSNNTTAQETSVGDGINIAQLLVNFIDLMASRGAIKGEELGTLAILRDRLIGSLNAGQG